MDRFRGADTDMLISTTVIEVGVDIPNATVMLVENAERFGLAQLHQLRGRIGRGAHRSYCVLFDESDAENQEARARIDAMVRTTDGFELADEDLRLRGEGTLFDTKQSGMPDLKLARLADDLDLVRRARTRAFALIDDDPHLDEHPALLPELRSRFEALDRLALPVLTDLCLTSPGRGAGRRLRDAGDRRQRERDAARPGSTRRPPRLGSRARRSVLQPRPRGSGRARARPVRGHGRHGDRGPLARGRAGRLRRSGARGVGGRQRQPRPDTAFRPRHRPHEGRGRVLAGPPRR